MPPSAAAPLSAAAPPLDFFSLAAQNCRSAQFLRSAQIWRNMATFAALVASRRPRKVAEMANFADFCDFCRFLRNFPKDGFADFSAIFWQKNANFCQKSLFWA